jgi:midasin (ATPase involved in ribosome maturation)
MSEGPDRVKQAVRRARHCGIFMVFVIVDNPESKVTKFVMPPSGPPDSRCFTVKF